MIIPEIITLKNYIHKENDIKKISIIVTIIIMGLIFIIFSFLISIKGNIQNLEMPAVYAINNISVGFKKIYGTIIMISIFTTAITVGMTFLKNVANNEKKYNKISNVLAISSILFSQIGFSNLINQLYPILGIFGIIQIIKIFQKQ